MQRIGKATALLTVAFLLVASTGCPKQAASPSSADQSNSTPTSQGSTATGVGGTAFREVTKDAGINYQWVVAGKRPLNILQTIGNGCAFLDYDGDGNLDILLVGPKLALYKGDGKGKFTDVTAMAGLDKLKGNFLGVAVGDIDNDGYDDLYVSAYRGGVLLRNIKGQRFEDVTKQAGLPSQPWSTSCAFGDVNNDGFLDLYVGNYVIFGPSTDPQLCDNSGVKSACGPRFYKPEKSRIYLGGPGMKFRDVTQQWNAHEVEGKSLGAVFADYNNSGKVSLAIANDEMPGDLLSNEGGKFKNVGKTSGTAYDDSGSVHGGMGTDWADYDNDGKLDLAVATFQNEAKNVYHNDGDGLFTDRSAMLGMAPSTPYVTFGIKWLDYDNDGWSDLVLANGHVQDNIADIDKTASYKQPVQLYHSQKGERFEDVSALLDAAARRPIVGRGLAVGDYDNDGKVDVLVVDSEGTPLLLHNETPSPGHYLSLTLVGTKSNRDGYGARVAIEAAGMKLMGRCGTDGSYLSASDKRIHFGLGSATTADTVTVYWPSGKKDVLKLVAADKNLTIREDSSPK